jgi:two-component system, NtrC family, sensor histidine kinase KinB
MFLFILLLILGGVSIFHIVRLQNDSREILKDNYESLQYGHEMLIALDKISEAGSAYFRDFEVALAAQEKNITEPEERRSTEAIRALFNRSRSGETSQDIPYKMRLGIYKLLEVNMAAIEAKNITAISTAGKAVTYITLIAAIIFIVALTFTVNFPAIITNPINALNAGIAEITAKNYKHRIHLDRKDEFGKMATAFNAMAERLEYFENSNLNKIIFEKTRAEAVINSLKDASLGIDMKNQVLFANQQALQLLDMKAEALVGKPVSEVAQKNDLFHFLMEEQNNMPFKVIVDGRENYFIKEVNDIGGDSAGGRVIVLKNITSFKELDVAKNNFIATISHELKTPLASSDLSLKLLQNQKVGDLTSEQKELVENLQRDNHRMLRILSELLNLAQVEAGKLQLNPQLVSPYQIANDAIDAVSGTAKEKGVVIVRDFPEGLNNVLADSEKTSWVLINLLTNAIKFSKLGGNIRFTLTKRDNELRFEIKDDGPGIPAELQQQVFERFFKAPGSTTAGFGLGLSISKEFIEAQGGKIWVSSSPGYGSAFIFFLPT